MADKKPTKRKRKNQTEEDANLTKDEEEVAKYMRFNLESKKSTLLGDEAYYFYGSKAVDFLMDSKWATGSKSSVVFTHRESVVAFLNKMLGNRYFDHVHVIKTEKKVKKKDGDKKKEDMEKKDDTDKKKESDKKKNDKPKTEDKEDKKEGKEIKKVKKKVKINLEPHEDQIFHDNEEEAYVWIYDPVSWKTFFFGILLVLAIIAVCLFPLWPENVREYSWYLSVAGAIFVGGILVLAVLRYVIYGILWICTLGKLHFWLLPNLTAECGFFESFVPAYEYSIYKSEEKDEEKKKKKKKDKDKDKSGSEKEKSGSEATNEKDEDQLEQSNQDNSIENIAAEDKLERENEDIDLAEEIEQPRIEELDDNIERKGIEHEDKGTKDDLSVDVINNTTDDTPEDISHNDDVNSDDLAYVDKLENESEESNGSNKEDGWVKVKKDDVSKNMSENENEVTC